MGHILVYCCVTLLFLSLISSYKLSFSIFNPEIKI